MCWAPNTRRLERVARFASRTLRLYERGVPLAVVEKALVLACARRLARPADKSDDSRLPARMMLLASA